MSKPYIKNGTPVGNESLCKTCSHTQIISGYRESEHITVCCYVNPNIVLPFTVNTCTGYYDKNRPTWQQMQKLAIHVTPGPLKPVGFKIGAGFQDAVESSPVVNDDDDFDEDDD